MPHPGATPNHGLLDLDVTVLHLAAVALETDGAGFRHLELGFQDFAVAGATGYNCYALAKSATDRCNGSPSAVAASLCKKQGMQRRRLLRGLRCQQRTCNGGATDRCNGLLSPYQVLVLDNFPGR